MPSHEKPRLSDTFNLACLSLKICNISILAFSILNIGSAFCWPKGLKDSRSLKRLLSVSYTHLRAHETV